MPLMLQSLVPELNPPKLQLLRFHCFIYFVSRWNRATKKVSPFWYGVWDRCGALHSTENQHLKNAKEKTQKTLIGSESNMSGLHLILEPCKICNDLAQLHLISRRVHYPFGLTCKGIQEEEKGTQSANQL
jgi:hypothetical protein